MPSISRNLNLIVLNHVLLDDGLARTQSWSLLDGSGVEVGLWNEAIVAWNMRRDLGGSHSQLVMLVALHLWLSGQFIAWDVPMCAYRLLELSLIVPTFRSVGLTRIAPKRLLRDGQMTGHLVLISHLWVSLPVTRCIAHAFLRFSGSRHHSLRLGWIILRSSGILEQCWIIHQVILNQIIGVLWRNFVVARLDSLVHTSVVIWAEARIVLQALIAIWLFLCCGLIVVTVKASLPGFEIGIGLVSDDQIV